MCSMYDYYNFLKLAQYLAIHFSPKDLRNTVQLNETPADHAYFIQSECLWW